MQLPSRASTALAVAVVSMSAAITGVAVDSLSSPELDLGAGVFTRIGDRDSAPLIVTGQVPPSAPLEYGVPDLDLFPLVVPQAPMPAGTQQASSAAPAPGAPGAASQPQAVTNPASRAGNVGPDLTGRAYGGAVSVGSDSGGSSGSSGGASAGSATAGSIAGSSSTGGSTTSGSPGGGSTRGGSTGGSDTQPGGVTTRPAPKPQPTQAASPPTRTKGNATSQSKADPNSQRVPGQDNKNADSQS